MSVPVTPYYETLQRFHKADIRFVVVGGVALGLHGSNIPTYDVDFAYALELENLERIVALLPEIHARILGRPAHDGFVIATGNLQRARFLNRATDLGKIDLMREIGGVDSFEGLWERSVAMDAGGFIVRVASIDDLIAMKRAANRLKDQMHIYELLALKKLFAETESEKKE